MAFNIENSFYQQFDILFYELLSQKGSILMPYVMQTEVVGETKTLRQIDGGKAKRGMLSASGNTEFDPILYDNRRLEPAPIVKSFAQNDIEMTKQGAPDVEQLARMCSDACGATLDDVIIEGIGGSVQTKSAGNIDLPLTQYICVDTTVYGNKGATLEGQGLTTSKVSFAVAALREKYNSPDLICVCSNRALGQLMTEERAASSLYNSVQTQSNGQMSPFGGVYYFAASEAVNKAAPGHKATGGALITKDSTTASVAGATVELAYIYAMDQVVLGSNMPFSLQSDKDPHRNFDLIFQCKGMYDCIRKQEEGVVAIEVNTSGTVIA